MTKTHYTMKQRTELKKNKYVKNCTNRYIIFTKEFKLLALEQHQQHIFSKDIFRAAWFPDYVIASEVPKSALKRRRKKQSALWVVEEKKGRVTKKTIDFNNMTLEEENQYLKTKLAYYEAIEEHIRTGLP